MASACRNNDIDEGDINDIFDAIVCSEENVTSAGYSEGLKKGKREGSLEGFHLGYHKGSEFGEEIGHYVGFAKAWLAIYKDEFAGASDTKRFTEKTILLLQKIIVVGSSFPNINVHDVDIINERDKLKSLYKRLCSVLKCSEVPPLGNKLSF